MARSASSFAVPISLLSAGLLVLGLGTLATGAPAHGSQADEVTTSPLRIVTYNADAGVKPASTMEDLATIMAQDPDVVALQEVASAEKRQLIRETYIQCEGCLWAGFMPLPAVPGGTPLLYRADRFSLLASGSEQVTEPTFVGKRGAGPSTIRAKFVNWVRLRDLRTGRPVHVLNNHTVPSVQGASGGPNYSNPERLKIYRRHMAGLQDLVEGFSQQYRGFVLVVGDLNVNYRRDRVLAPAMFPYRRLGDVGLSASYEPLGEPRLGTHTLASGNDTRLIDYVYFRPRRAVQPAAQRIMRGLSSDHRPLLVEFQVTPRNVASKSPSDGP